MPQPLVSVIIPVFNGADCVREAIQSALQQTGCQKEIVVVNDGSTDDTAEVLQSFGTDIVVVHQENQGLPKTRNRGVQAAKGEWIAFLDHDDIWLPDKLSRQLQQAEQSGADIIYTNARNFGESQRVDELRQEPAAMLSGDLFLPLLQDNFLVVSSVMLSRRAFTSVGGFTEDALMVEDWDLWLRLAAAGFHFSAVPEALTLYRWRGNSLSKNHDRVRYFRERALERAFQTERGRMVPWLIRQQARASVQRCSAWFLASTSPSRAMRWYAHSLCYWPFDATSWKGLVKGCLGRS